MTLQTLEFDFDARTKSRKQFDAFNLKNPHVVGILESIVKRYLEIGATRIGINHICEVARYEIFFKTVDAHSDFQISNNYRPHYADLLIERNPSLDGVIVRHSRWAK